MLNCNIILLFLAVFWYWRVLDLDGLRRELVQAVGVLQVGELHAQRRLALRDLPHSIRSANIIIANIFSFYV
jgi:hypothetical protein